MDKQVRRIGRRVLTIYNEQEDEALASAEEGGAKCEEGCHHCCKRIVLASLGEGICIAERLMTEPEYMAHMSAIMRGLYAQVKFLEKNSTSSVVDCVFLKATGTCAIYKYRPAVCRYLYVVSDPENCLPDNDKKVSMIDMRDLDARVWSEADRISKQVGLPHRLVAPLPVVVLWGMKILQEGVSGFIESLPTLGSGLQPSYWIQRLVAVQNEGSDTDHVVQKDDEPSGDSGEA